MQTRRQVQRGSVTFLSHTATWRLGQDSGVSLENPKDSVPSRLVPERELVDRRGSSPPGSVAAGWETMEMELGRWGPLLGWALSVPSPLPQTWHTSLCRGSSGLKAWCLGHRGVSGIAVRVSRPWPCLGALRTFPALHPTRGNGAARDTHPPSRDRARAGSVLALNVPPGSPRGPTSGSPLCLRSSRFGLWGSSPASTCSPPLGEARHGPRPHV